MINKNIIKAILNSSSKENKDIVINELLNHIFLNYDYNDEKAGHILEMLVDSKTIVKTEDIDLDYINNNLDILMYHHDKYNIRNIKISNIDNIECKIRIDYECLEKINENRSDVSYEKNYSNVSFIDNPDVLKKNNVKKELNTNAP